MPLDKVQFKFLNHLEPLLLRKSNVHDAIVTIPKEIPSGGKETTLQYGLPAEKRSSVEIFYEPQGSSHGNSCLLSVLCAQNVVSPTTAAHFSVSAVSACPHMRIKATPTASGNQLTVTVSFAAVPQV